MYFQRNDGLVICSEQKIKNLLYSINDCISVSSKCDFNFNFKGEAVAGDP